MLYHLQANFESMNHSLHAYKQEHDQSNINILTKRIWIEDPMLESCVCKCGEFQRW
jgi:hypothetical protein